MPTLGAKPVFSRPSLMSAAGSSDSCFSRSSKRELTWNYKVCAPHSSQNRACSITAHGSSYHHSQNYFCYPCQFRFHSLSTSVCSQYSPLCVINVSPSRLMTSSVPFLHRNYSISLVLCRYPTSFRRLTALTLLSLVRHYSLTLQERPKRSPELP